MLLFLTGTATRRGVKSFTLRSHGTKGVNSTVHAAFRHAFVGRYNYGGKNVRDNVTSPLLLRGMASSVNASGSSFDESYDYDFLVIGGGSGGIASARRAATYGAKVAVVESVCDACFIL